MFTQEVSADIEPHTMNAALKEDILAPCLKSLSLFNDQSNELLRFLSAKSELIQVARGDLVCEKGNRSQGLFCVLSGSVKVAVISHLGNERVMEIVSAGGTFGEAAMFLERPCPIYAEALIKSQLVFFRRRMIVEAIRRYPEFALNMFSGISERVLRLVRDVEICCLQPAADRVVSFILDHATQVEQSNGAGEVRLPAGKAVIASNLNLTPETFSRELHALVDKGLIDVEKRTIRVPNLQALHTELLTEDN